MRRRDHECASATLSFLGSPGTRQYVRVGRGGPSGGQPRQRSGPGARGAVVALAGVRLRGRDRRGAATDGISLVTLPGQSVALYDRGDGSAAELLDVIGGLRPAKSGEVSVEGVAVHRLGGAALERYRGERGLLSPRFPLLSSLSVTDNVLAALRTRRADATARDQAAEMLVAVGAAHLVARGVDTLAAEQQWRVLIARALLAGPRLMLAEDPAPGLDSRAARRVLDLLMDAHARLGFTLLLATGRLATTVRCDRVVSLADGHVTADELTDDDAWTRDRVDRIG